MFIDCLTGHLLSKISQVKANERFHGQIRYVSDMNNAGIFSKDKSVTYDKSMLKNIENTVNIG